MWKSGTCRVDYIPALVSDGEATTVSNAVAKDYAQKLMDTCADPNDSSAYFGVSPHPIMGCLDKAVIVWPRIAVTPTADANSAVI